MCRDLRERCRRLDLPSTQAKLQKELRDAAMGTAWWQRKPDDEEFPRLLVPRGKVPLSLWDWQVWPQAHPTKSAPSKSPKSEIELKPGK